MTFDEFKNIVTKIIEHSAKLDQYTESLPSEFVGFIDNPYTNHQGMICDILMDVVFNDTLREPVYWLMYEWKPDAGITLEDKKGIPVTIDTLGDFFQYMSTNYVW